MDRAKAYSACKYGISIAETVYLLAVLVFFALSGASNAVAGLSARAPSPAAFAVYLFIVSLGYSILNFPLSFYQSYVLERNFSLSKQSLPDWFKDQLKAGALYYVVSFALFSAFYYLVGACERHWWLIVSLVWIFFNILAARLLPVIIIPLFFKSRPLQDEGLKARITGLAEKMRVKILDVFEIDFSKKTLKANAALVGMGNTRRVLLADTLKDKYTHDEIESILAHEFAHYKLRHILKLIVINSFATLLTFYIIYCSNGYFLKLFRMSSLKDIAAFPLVLIYFILFGLVTGPFTNLVSRHFEKDADKMALDVTGSKSSFISMMEKLASQNLADRNPSLLIKIFFFDHPPIDDRIRLARGRVPS